MIFKNGNEDHHSITYDAIWFYREYNGLHELDLREECYVSSGTYRVDFIGIRRGDRIIDGDGIFGCDEEIIVGEVKPPDEYVSMDSVKKLIMTTLSAQRELNDKGALMVAGESGGLERAEINVKDNQRACALVLCHKFSDDLMERVTNKIHVSIEKVSEGIYNSRGNVLDTTVRIVRIGELAGDRFACLRMLGRGVTVEDVKLFDEQVRALLERAPGMRECCERIMQYSRKYNEGAFLSYEKKDEEERKMGYYTEVRNAGISQGYSQGYSLACDNVSNLFRKLEDTGRQQFTVDDINAVLNELRNSCEAAPEGNGDQVAKE